ncbi:MAG TPA: lysylphosphatidylglycerol synthase transmembrane domain-containing protein [Syntrophorhabdaceae bacterium]|nr:lysylphosphatidylglycerol synthase transmembrane domain-containing protein [Syntrophorhabdaceae bacterium]
MKKHKIITVTGFVISLLLLYLSLKGVELRKLFYTLQNADMRFSFIPLACIFLCLTLCAYRWSKVVGCGVRVRDTFIALVIGLFINNVLPARIGEIARGYALSKKTGISFTYSVTTVLVDRFFDLVGLLIITFIFLPKHNLPQGVSRALYMLVGLFIVCATALITLSRKRFAGVISDKLAGIKKPFFSKLAKRVLEIQENLRRISSPLNLAYFVAIAFVTWLSMSLALYFTMLALGVKIGIVYVPFVCALLNMGLVIPSSPGYVGVYQWLLVNLLALFNVPNYQALAVSIVFQATWYIPYSVLGFVFLIKEHLRIQEIQKLEE